jgi:PAS domain S-box-containing protein
MRNIKGKTVKEKLAKEYDIVGSRQAEETISLNNQRMESLIKILQYNSENVQQFLDYALDEAIKLTGSKIGYIYYYSEEKEEFTLNTWSKDVMQQCAIANPQTIYKLEKTGIWGEAVRQRKPIVLNDFKSPHPLKKGYPDGHAHLSKYLTLPVFSGNKIVAVVAVANKKTDYDQSDVLQLTILMDSVWKVVDRKKAEEALHESEERFSKAYRTSPISFMIANMEDGRIIEVNDAFATISGFTREEALASSTLSLNMWVHEEDRQHMITTLHDGHAVIRQETMLRAKNGNILTVLLSAQVIQLGHRNCIISSIEDITERKRAEEALKESELRTRQIIENAPFGAHHYVLEPGQRLVFKGANPAADSILGVQNQQFIGKTIEEAFPPLTQTPIPDKYRHVAVTGERYDTEQVDYEHGSIKGAFSVHAFRTSPNHMTAFFIDITDRKQVEEALRKSEQKYRSIFENVQDVYYETTIDGVIIDISPSISILSKGFYTREELIGQSLYRFYVDPEERVMMINELKKNTSIGDYEIKLRNKDGSIIYCSLSSKLNLDSKGEPEKLIGSMRDITQRKTVEEALSRSQKEFQNYFESGAVGMSVTDSACKWIQVNQKLCTIIGYSKDELIGQEWTRFTHPDDLKMNMELFQKVLDGKINSYELDKRFLCKDGRVVFVTVSVVCERNPDGSFHHLIASYIDITERKHFEEELVNARDKAEESDRLKTAFLHNISHEIRTPMNAIMGFATLLEIDSDAATRKSYIDVISQSSNHLLSIISDIVDISNIEAALVKTSKEEFNLNAIFKAVYDQHIQKAKEKKIDLAFETGLANPEANILTDKTKLIQILSNLISNAIKFTQQGSIKFSYRPKQAMLEFTVSDTGIGIPKEQQPKIFDRFYQVHNQASRTYEGTGLGLAISKAYVELLGGTLKVVSAPGSGSSFIFTLPFEKKEDKSISLSQETVKHKFFFKVKKKILVAEDVESNFQLIKYFLTGTNAEVVRAVNGQEAVDLCLSDKDIDLVLMDIKMPVMDGYTATRTLRENNISIPIIAQTAYADDKNQAMRSGCTGFISKPFDKFDLLQAINELI